MNEFDSLPFAVGDCIAGKYRIDGLIGAGGMGVVLEATHVDLERKVAVKLIRPELATDELLVERLLLEARAAARIQSEHVGAVLDVGRLESGTPFIVMEYLQGLDLAHLLSQRGRLDVGESVDLLLGACEALASAHQQRIVHRDLKPENLFVITTPTGERRLKVLDFGISKRLGDPTRRALTNPETAIGSPHYMAPEQMQGDVIDVRVDIWAIGTILYEMLAGVRAFDGDTIPVVCAQVLGGVPAPVTVYAPSVPNELSCIIERCLSKDRDHRYDSVARLAEELAPFGGQRAAHSLSHIHALLGAPPKRPTGAGAVEPVSRASLDSASAGTAKGFTLDSVRNSSPSPPRARPSLWPIWVGVGVALSSAIGIWFFARHELEKERLAREAKAEQRLLEARDGASQDGDRPTRDPTSRPSRAGGARLGLAESETVDAGLRAGDPNPVVRPVPTESAPARRNERRDTEDEPRSGRALPSPTPRNEETRIGAPDGKPARRTEPGPGANETDAWDPGSFGGRH